MRTLSVVLRWRLQQYFKDQIMVMRGAYEWHHARPLTDIANDIDC